MFFETSIWYQKVFDLKSEHGGNEFDVLVNTKEDVVICLHSLDAHNHPSFIRGNNSNGVILYFRIDNYKKVYENLLKLDHKIEKELMLNPNSNKKEFSFIDPNGYYITVSEMHKFKG